MKADVKRYGNLWDKICEKENVEIAFNNVLRKKKHTSKGKWLLKNKEVLIEEVVSLLINQTYVFNELKSFVITKPKVRQIHHSPLYPDKILHHCIMNVIAPIFMEKFTADTYSSIKGRGITQCMKKVKEAVRKSNDAYYVQLDCDKFYQSINHDVIKMLIRRVIKCSKTLCMLDAIVDTHDEGLAIGMFPSQYLGNLVLTPVDHWAKEVLRVKYYFRYMDDIVMILPNKESAWNALRGITQELTKLKLTLKNNTRIAPVKCGIDFIGYKFYPTHTLLRKSIKLNMQRNVRRLLKQNVNDAVFKRKTASHFGWCKHADCRNLLKTTFKDKYELYKMNMEFKRLSEIKDANNWFALPREVRVSIETLIGKDIAILEYIERRIRGEDKIVVKFVFPEEPTFERYFITRSEVVKDRLFRDKEHLPFVVTMKKVKGYYAYE